MRCCRPRRAWQPCWPTFWALAPLPGPAGLAQLRAQREQLAPALELPLAAEETPVLPDLTSQEWKMQPVLALLWAAQAQCLPCCLCQSGVQGRLRSPFLMLVSALVLMRAQDGV